MNEIRYIISDASKKVDVETHVLRYWEEELSLDIPRNEMGHRYYREQDIEIMKVVKELKEQGFQLRAIRMLLPDIKQIGKLDSQSILKLKEELNNKVINLNTTEVIMDKHNQAIVSKKNRTHLEGDLQETKMGQFKEIMSDLIVNSMRDGNKEMAKEISGCVSDSIIKEMDYLLRLKEEREDERFKKLDETIRNYQRNRQEIAATETKIHGRSKKKKGLFHK
jgi:MerR family transcriptional regulator, light-induced transcriptional regulator